MGEFLSFAVGASYGELLALTVAAAGVSGFRNPLIALGLLSAVGCIATLIGIVSLVQAVSAYSDCVAAHPIFILSRTPPDSSLRNGLPRIVPPGPRPEAHGPRARQFQTTPHRPGSRFRRGHPFCLPKPCHLEVPGR